ncbi:MAG TPA: hypothetical protein EYG79_00285 [Rhodobacteraceae bacterium]|nr:hypothetical protein [Paracoccaceae bacterium]
MKYLFFLAVFVIGAYFAPQILESKGGPCQAFEAKLTGEIGAQNDNAGLLTGIASSISNGELGKRIATREYDSLPAGLACVRAYYTLDTDDISL